MKQDRAVRHPLLSADDMINAGASSSLTSKHGPCALPPSSLVAAFGIPKYRKTVRYMSFSKFPRFKRINTGQGLTILNHQSLDAAFFFLFSILSFTFMATRYAAIIDSGSSSSRMWVYSWTEGVKPNIKLIRNVVDGRKLVVRSLNVTIAHLPTEEDAQARQTASCMSFVL